MALQWHELYSFLWLNFLYFTSYISRFKIISKTIKLCSHVVNILWVHLMKLLGIQGRYMRQHSKMYVTQKNWWTPELMLIQIKSVITPMPANIYIWLSLLQRIMICKIRDKIQSRAASRNITNDLVNLNIKLNRHVLCMKGNRIPWAQENACQRTTCGTQQYVKSPIASRCKQTKMKQY